MIAVGVVVGRRAVKYLKLTSSVQQDQPQFELHTEYSFLAPISTQPRTCCLAPVLAGPANPRQSPPAVYGAAVHTPPDGRPGTLGTRERRKTQKEHWLFNLSFFSMIFLWVAPNFVSPPTARKLAFLLQPTVAAKILTSLHRKALLPHGP